MSDRILKHVFTQAARERLPTLLEELANPARIRCHLPTLPSTELHHRRCHVGGEPNGVLFARGMRVPEDLLLDGKGGACEFAGDVLVGGGGDELVGGVDSHVSDGSGQVGCVHT